MSDPATSHSPHATASTRPSDNLRARKALRGDSEARLASPNNSSSYYTYSRLPDAESTNGSKTNAVTPVSNSTHSTLPCASHRAITVALPVASHYVQTMDDPQGDTARARHPHKVPTEILLGEVLKILAPHHITDSEASDVAQQDKGGTPIQGFIVGSSKDSIDGDLQNLNFQAGDKKRTLGDTSFKVTTNRQTPPNSSRHRRSHAIDISPKIKTEQSKHRAEYVIEPSPHINQYTNGESAAAPVRSPAHRHNKKQTNVHFDPHVTVVRYDPLTQILD